MNNYVNYGEIEQYKRKYFIIITLTNIISFLSGYLISNNIFMVYINNRNSTL